MQWKEIPLPFMKVARNAYECMSRFTLNSDIVGENYSLQKLRILQSQFTSEKQIDASAVSE